jgi:hypothetical protein
MGTLGCVGASLRATSTHRQIPVLFDSNTIMRRYEECGLYHLSPVCDRNVIAVEVTGVVTRSQ